MTQAVKFTFNEMFDTPSHGGSERTPQERRKTRWSEEEIDALKEEARAQGFAEAQAASETRLAEASAAALQQIAESVSTSVTSFEALQTNARADAATLALSIARKLADVLISLRPEAEIEAVIKECLTHLNREPRLVVRVHADLIEQVEGSIQQAATERGMADKIMIVGDAEMEKGDCEIEWSDGGVERNRADLDRQATEIIERYIETLSSERNGAVTTENHHG
ncbi:MAG: FliH/SctL family protein [Parvibaculaceae bacterium]